MSVGLIGCAGSLQLVKRSQMHMGTLVFLTAVAPDEQIAHRAVQEGFAEIHRLETILSTWIPDSELSRVNASAGQMAIEVGPETLEILTQSLKMDRLTQGRFNIAIGPAVEAWNVSREGRIPSSKELDAARPLINLGNLQIDQELRTVYLGAVSYTHLTLPTKA